MAAEDIEVDEHPSPFGYRVRCHRAVADSPREAPEKGTVREAPPKAPPEPRAKANPGVLRLPPIPFNLPSEAAQAARAKARTRKGAKIGDKGP